MLGQQGGVKGGKMGECLCGLCAACCSVVSREDEAGVLMDRKHPFSKQLPLLIQQPTHTLISSRGLPVSTENHE